MQDVRNWLALVSVLTLIVAMYKRVQIFRAMKTFEGRWEALEMDGRNPGRKMEGAFLTYISPRWLSLEPGILDVSAQDWDSSNGKVRTHHGQIKIDPVLLNQGIRTTIYDLCSEIAHQRVEFGDSSSLILISSAESDYSKHALRRTSRVIDC